MKHETIIISGSDLMNRWDNDNRTAAEVAGLDAIEPDAYYRVSWPEHVLTPQFNGDCDIAGPLPQEMVLRLGDGSCLCDECLEAEYPGKEEPETGWVLGVCHRCNI